MAYVLAVAQIPERLGSYNGWCSEQISGHFFSDKAAMVR